MATIRVRKNAGKMAVWDNTLLLYARAVREMQTRGIDKPTSWRFQAAIHEYDEETDPLQDPTDVRPSTADQGKFWDQCQHGSWFFLPWHRLYLSCFEQIVADTITALGENGETWALPYWNYSGTDQDSRKLPEAFRTPQLPDGTANPLMIQNRNAGNNNDRVGSPFHVDLSCLDNPVFDGAPTGGNPGFGGRQSGQVHSGGGVGAIEGTPHGAMHVAVGDWMGGFDTAALDPIFWLHHCNIDRLWEVWMKRNPLHRNPTDAAWQTTVKFTFNKAGGGTVTLPSGSLVDTKSVPLHYEYDDIADPRPAQPGGGLESVTRRPVPEGIPEMIGATEGPIELAGQSKRAQVGIREPEGAGLESVRSGSERLFLNFENVTGVRRVQSYRVFVNVPDGENPDSHPELCAGLLPMFGLVESTRPEANRTGSGLETGLDITEIVGRLRASGRWQPDDVRVTFVPDESSELEGTGDRPVRIGRMSVYVS